MFCDNREDPCSKLAYILSANKMNTLFRNMVIIFLWESQRFFLIPFEFACCAVVEHANRSQHAKGFRFNVLVFELSYIYL